MKLRKCTTLDFLILGAAVFSTCLAEAATTKKKVKKKQNITVIDPKAAAASKTDRAQPGEDTTKELPSALAGKSQGKSEGMRVDDSPVLEQDSLPPLQMESLKRLIGEKRYEEAVTTLEIWLALRLDIHTGERLRLNLIRSELLGRMGKYRLAFDSLGSTRRYLELATDDLTNASDRKRVQELKSHVDLLEFDLREMQGGIGWP